jgi:hypothetical protein
MEIVTVQLPVNSSFGFPVAVFTATTLSSYHIFLQTPPGTPVSIFFTGPKSCRIEMEVRVPLELLEEEVAWDVPELASLSSFVLLLSFTQEIEGAEVTSKTNGEGACEIELPKVASRQILQMTL